MKNKGPYTQEFLHLGFVNLTFLVNKEGKPYLLLFFKIMKNPQGAGLWALGGLKKAHTLFCEPCRRVLGSRPCWPFARLKA